MDEVLPKIEGILHRMAMLYGWSPLTVDAYQRDLSGLQSFLIAIKSPHSVFNITQQEVTDFLKDLQQQSLNQKTIQRKRSVLATWFYYLQNEKLRKDFPMQGMVHAISALRLPKYISEQHIEDLLQAPDITTSRGVRDRSILEMLYATGLRVSELVSLKKSDINLTRRTLRVVGKGNKEREVPFGEVAAEWLERWLQVSPKGSPFVYPGRTGAVSRQTIWHCVQNYAKLIGLNPVPSPHVLRHAFATHLLNHGADLRAVQTLLGHENITTTEIYTHVSRTKMHDEVNMAHPMGRK